MSHIPNSFYSVIEAFPQSNKKILLVSHDLSLTGAPIVLFNIAKILKKNGFSVAVVAYNGGALMKKFEEENIPVCISFAAQARVDEIHTLGKLFDLVIANTVVTYRTLWHIRKVCKVIWLIHESKNFETDFLKWYDIPQYGCPGITEILAQVKDIYTVSEYSKAIFDKYSDNVKVIYNGVEKPAFCSVSKSSKPIFLFVGKVQYRKAVDVFVDAVAALPDRLKMQAEFVIVGDTSETYAKKLMKKSKKFIQWKGVVTDKNKMADLYQKADLLVCVSRDDTAPLVVAEAAACGLPAVISESVGSTYLIENYQSGFVIPTDDSEALRKVIEKVIKTPDILKDMSERVLQKYLKTSTPELFETRFLSIIDEKLQEEEYE